jgi:hypothetical protein
MNEFFKLAFGALASAAGVAGILYGLLAWLSRSRQDAPLAGSEAGRNSPSRALS